mgnify:CR=1 FL=1
MQPKESGQTNLKYKAKFIYLISPNKINSNFFIHLKTLFKTNRIKYFQLRLKKTPEYKIIEFSRKIKKICKTFKVKFIINDNPIIAKKVKADGCHLGQSDMNIKDARKIIKNKIIGITCHNSIKLAKIAIKNNADYIAFGAFNKSRTKKVKFKASISLIKKIKKVSNIPIVAIGGIDDSNYKKLLLNKADFLAMSGYIWNNKKLKPSELIKRLK